MNYCMNITTTALSHLGLVSGSFDELGITDLIGNIIPKNRNHNFRHKLLNQPHTLIMH